MATVQVRSQVSVDELINGVAQLDLPELEHFIAQVLSLHARRLTHAGVKTEAELIAFTNQKLPPEAQARYDDLTAKRRAETLLPAEHEELLALIEQIELSDAARVQALVDLALRRDCSVATLMQDLGIQPPAYA